MSAEQTLMWPSRCLRALAMLGPLCLTGCTVADLATADRYSNGLVVVLPGIEGRSIYNVNIARGLADGHVKSAIEIFDWGLGTPGGFLVNLTALERNRRQAEKLARRIVRYQEAFPGRPVHLIGHSGGAGIVVLALDALPEGRRVTAAYLLAAAVAPDHDLTVTLEHSELGIWNFYSPKDVGFLAVGTSVFGLLSISTRPLETSTPPSSTTPRTTKGWPGQAATARIWAGPGRGSPRIGWPG